MIALRALRYIVGGFFWVGGVMGAISWLGPWYSDQFSTVGNIIVAVERLTGPPVYMVLGWLIWPRNPRTPTSFAERELHK